MEIIDLKVTAKFGTISLKMANDFRDISAFNIVGITASYIMKVSHATANVQLSSVNVKDLNAMSIYRDVNNSFLSSLFNIN